MQAHPPDVARSPSNLSLQAATEAHVGWAAERLAASGIEHPRYEAQLLLAHALGVSRGALLATLHPPIFQAQLDAYQDLVHRRCRRVPIAYLRGSQEFYGLRFLVSVDTLVPRPETELLVEAALEHLRTRPQAVMVDACTGSGCVAIACAVSAPGLRVVASDLSMGAARMAARNCMEHGVGRRCSIICGDALTAVGSAVADVVTANPPYIPSADLAELQPEVRDHEPRLAIDGGPDGLAVVTRIAAGAATALRLGGLLALEVGIGQARSVEQMLRQFGFAEVRAVRDIGGIERAVLGYRGSCNAG